MQGIRTRTSFGERFKSVRERAEFHSGWALLAWALALFLHPPDYAALARHGSPLVWAVLPGLLGAVQIIATFGFSFPWQRRTALLAAGTWGFIEYFLIFTHSHVVMITVIPTFLVANALSFLFAPPAFLIEAFHARPNIRSRLTDAVQNRPGGAEKKPVTENSSGPILPGSRLEGERNAHASP